MKSNLTMLALMALLAAPTMSSAIDAKPKSSGTQTTQAPADSTGARKAASGKATSSQSLLEKLKKDVRESQKSAAPQYDNYIDANNDGVDDRVQEKSKTKESDKAKPEKTVKAAAPSTTDSSGHVKKKKPR